jgi:alginate lyase
MTRLGVVIGALCAVLAVTGVASPGPQATGSVRAGPLLLLDRAVLADVQNRIRAGDERLKAALAALEDDARKGLEFGPVSVMDKTITPPSGNKHDYMSQAPYWWPDPSKPNGRPYIRKDGERNPEINKLPDHDNLGRLASTVATLGLAYQLTYREEYANHAARLLRVWFLDPATRMTPHLQYGQGIPGINDGRGIGIIETRGLPEMLDGALMVSDSQAWTDADNVALQQWMRAYVTWLVESPYGKDEAKNGNNHETWYDVQVAALAMYSGESKLFRRTLMGARSRISRQIRPDGRQPRELERTRSWDYSIFNLRAFFDLATLSEHANLDLWNYRTADGRSLRKALDYLVPFASGERKWTDAQITAFRASELYPLLRRGSVAWKEPKYRELAGKVGGASAKLDLTAR